MSTNKRKPSPSAIDALTCGTLEVVGRLPWGSNFTFLVDVDNQGDKSRAIYKPFEGEQPLWDFPEGIYKREVAAYELSVALGWPNIPEIIVRKDGPFGIGSLQRFVPSDFEQHYFTLAENFEHDKTFKTMATFDVIANNADRKAGHTIFSDEGEIWAIDNALCFNIEPKLRTVIWEYGGETVDADLLEDLARIKDQIPESVVELLAREEVEALQRRVGHLLEVARLPKLETQRQYPWPLI